MSLPRCLLSLVAALCPLSAPALTLEVYYAGLSGANESPPNPSAGSGEAIVSYDPDSFMMRVRAVFSGLSAATTVSHIHCCIQQGMTTAGVATQTPSFAGFPTGVTSGSYDGTFDMTLASSYNATFIAAQGGSVSGALAALLAGMRAGTSYFNIHSTMYPGGELRGNLMLDTLFAGDFEQH